MREPEEDGLLFTPLNKLAHCSVTRTLWLLTVALLIPSSVESVEGGLKSPTDSPVPQIKGKMDFCGGHVTAIA